MDLEKWKQFLQDMNIRYEDYENKSNGNRIIRIDQDYIYQSYSNSIDIIFNSSGNFIKFEAYGD